MHLAKDYTSSAGSAQAFSTDENAGNKCYCGWRRDPLSSCNLQKRHANSAIQVHNGTSVPSLNYFPNIVHPLDELKQFEFKVMRITHKHKLNTAEHTVEKRASKHEFSASTRVDIGVIENGLTTPPNRPTIRRTLTRMIDQKDKPRKSSTFKNQCSAC